MSGQQKSYKEIAEVLRELGVEGITEELTDKLEEQSAAYPSEVELNKTAMLLSAVGHGNFNWETKEWSFFNNGVYSFDMEVFDVESMYTTFLSAVSALGGDDLAFTDIQEDTTGVDWEEGTGTRTVSFSWKGNVCTLEAEAMNDWFDVKVLGKLNEIICSGQTGKQLFFTSDGYQELIVFYNSREWADAFREKTGLPLYTR